jgi:hypothetical protein
MTGEELQSLRNWADDKVTASQEPPWTWYQYMKLREALDAIIGGMECTAIQMESSPPVREHPDSGPRLIAVLAWWYPILSQVALQSERGAFIGRTTQPPV